MKRAHMMLFAAGLTTACSNKSAEPPAPVVKAEAAEPLKATVWTAAGELYLEYPPLVAGRKERFAIHLTRLVDFKAVTDAHCEVRLVGSASAEIFACDASTHPGIFGANVTPKPGGDSRLAILVRGKDMNETFDVGLVRVAADAA